MSLKTKQTHTCDVCGNRFTTSRQDVIDSGLCPDCFIASKENRELTPAKPVEIKNGALTKILDIEKEKAKDYVRRQFIRFEEMQLYHLKILTDYRDIETKYGTQKAIDVLNLEDNTEYTILLHKVLKRKLVAQKLGVDIEIGVICTGKVEGEAFKYYDYEVFPWDPNMLLE